MMADGVQFAEHVDGKCVHFTLEKWCNPGGFRLSNPSLFDYAFWHAMSAKKRSKNGRESIDGEQESGPSHKGEKSYTGDELATVRGAESVRQRPGCHIPGRGGIDSLHYCVGRFLENAVDEAVAGHCKLIDVTLQSDGSISIRDNGRGISIKPTTDRTYQQSKMPEIEFVFLVPRFLRHLPEGYHYFSGVQNHGIMAVNALCEFLRVDVQKAGRIHTVRFEDGATKDKLMVTGRRRDRTATGTCVTFKLDSQFFQPGAAVDAGRLRDRLHELACIFPPLKFTFCDRRIRPTKRVTIQHGRGLGEYLERLPNESAQVTARPIIIRGSRGGVAVNIAMRFNECLDTRIRCFTNGIPNSLGGTHFFGFRKGLLWALRLVEALGDLRDPDAPPLTESDVLRGVTAAISLHMERQHCRFDQSEQQHLSNIETTVESIVRSELMEYFGRNEGDATTIVYFCRRAAGS